MDETREPTPRLITVDAGWLDAAREQATAEVAAMIDNAVQNGEQV